MLPDNVKTKVFMEDLHRRFGKKEAGPSQYQKAHQEKIEQLKTLNRFKMLGENETSPEVSENEEFSEINKMSKFYKDLNEIKQRNKQTKEEMLKGDGVGELSKREEKKIKKLLKE